MINYNRLGYGIKRDLTNFFIHQIIYGILAGNKVDLSEIARSLKEHISLKKTIERLSRNLNAFDENSM